MSPQELISIGERVFGPASGWQTRAAAALGYDKSSISRWASGQVPMPKHAVLLLRYMDKYGVMDKK